MDGDEIETLVRAAYRVDRLYPIRSSGCYGFYAGRLPDERQALVTCGYAKQVCAYLFTAEGEYLGMEHRKPQLSGDFEEPGRAPLERELHDYLAAEFGFVPGLIRVKRFCEPATLVSIDPLPSYLSEFADGSAHDAEEERARNLNDLRRWVAEGAFVLNCWNDFWLDANGEVTSS